MFFWNKICGLILIFLLQAIFSYGQRLDSLSFLNSNFLFLNSSDQHVLMTISKKKDPEPYYFLLKFSNKKTMTTTIPSDLSICNNGFFCRQELKIEKVAKVAIRIRLGSLEQCNFYEGKP